jgi:hypothetical protein
LQLLHEPSATTAVTRDVALLPLPFLRYQPSRTALASRCQPNGRTAAHLPRTVSRAMGAPPGFQSSPFSLKNSTSAWQRQHDLHDFTAQARRFTAVASRGLTPARAGLGRGADTGFDFDSGYVRVRF